MTAEATDPGSASSRMSVPSRGSLPSRWMLRRPTLGDVPAILELVRACEIAAVGDPDWTADEIVETLTAPNHDRDRDSWLVDDAAGRLVAWAYLDNPARKSRDLVDIYTLPEAGEPAQGPLLDLAVARVAERARDWGFAEMVARAGVIASELRYVAALRAAGFQFARRHARMRRELTDVASPVVPPGVLIRPLRGDDDADLRQFFEILEAAFADTEDHVPAEYTAWRKWIDSLPSVDYDEWFVAEVDGVPAGVLQSSDQVAEFNEGWVKNLAVLRRYRKRGVGAALLATAFARYAAKGRTAAGLGVDLTNPTGAYRLYTSVGMVPAYEADVYERTVPAAPAPW